MYSVVTERNENGPGTLWGVSPGACDKYVYLYNIRPYLKRGRDRDRESACVCVCANTVDWCSGVRSERESARGKTLMRVRAYVLTI